MENSPILRSLVAGGRPSGTGRSTSSPAPERSVEARESAREPFERHVERARESSRREESARKSARNDAAPAESESAAPTDANKPPPESDAQLDAFAGLQTPATDAANPQVAASDAEQPAAPAATPQSDPRAQSTSAPATSASVDAPVNLPPAPELAAVASLETPAAPSELVAFDGPPASSAPKPQRGAANASAEQDANSTNSPASAVATPELVNSATNESVAEPQFASTADNAVAAPQVGADAHSASAREPALPTPTPADAGARHGDGASAAKGEAPTPSAPPSLDAERSAEVLRQVRLRLSPELRQAVIQLEPRELGRIAIRISVTRGVVRAELRAEQQATLDALERHAPELKAALERVGLGAESFALQLGFDDASAHEGPAGELPRGSRQRTSDFAAGEQPLSSAQLRSVATRLAAAGGVDTYA